jgi:hypothetical protein
MKIRFLLLSALAAGTAFAQNSYRFAVTRNVIAGGGATSSSSARFQLGSTVAQQLAAVPGSARFSIQGGFWIRPAPILFAPAKTGTNFELSIQTELGETYVIQYVNALSDSHWQNLESVTGNGSVMTVTNSTAGVSNRFFRLLQQ